MSILLIAHAQFPPVWGEAFERVLGGQGLAIWPEAHDQQAVECAIVARPEAGVLSGLPNLRLVSSTGMGVDHILGLPDLPAHVPVARVVTPIMVDQVAEYVTLSVLRTERQSDHFDGLQRQGKWERRLTGRPGGKLRVGLLGHGVIGAEIARRLVFLGFRVKAWAARERTEGAVAIVAGRAGLEAVLAASDILVCALPGSPATENLLDYGALARLPRGAHVVNVGRGEHIDDEALLALIDSGHLSGATLDVFRTEPLPAAHPFWRHPNVHVTPHSAGLLDPVESASAILRNLERVRAGLPPDHLVCR